MSNGNLNELELTIGHQFSNVQLLEQAITHSSYANERKINKILNYERIEFLGDAVLEVIVSDYLYCNYPEKHEGELTRLRASLVCEYTLASCARDIGLGEYVLLSKGEMHTGGRNRDSILCDLFEAVLGAIFLDGGMKPATQYVMKFLLNDIEGKSLFYDAKTTLQEIVQEKDMGKLSYDLVEATGPDHAKNYVTSVLIHNEEIARGSGHSIKNAEQMAAYQAILKIKNK